MDENKANSPTPIRPQPVAQPAPTTFQFPQLGQVADTPEESIINAPEAPELPYLARQLQPVIQEAAIKLKEAVAKLKSDYRAGMITGVVLILALHYIFKEK